VPQKMNKAERDKMIEALLDGVEDLNAVLSEGGLLAQLKKRSVERILEAEMSEHLGYDKHDPTGRDSGQTARNPLGESG